jgi:hypothetical protein
MNWKLAVPLVLSVTFMAGCGDIGDETITITQPADGNPIEIPKEVTVAQLSFEGNVDDQSIYRNIGTAFNPIFVQGRKGLGLRFDGTSSSFVFFADRDCYHAFEPTVEAWIRPTGIDLSNTIVSENIQGADADGRGFLLDIERGRMRFANGDGKGIWKIATGLTLLQTERWYHVVGTYFNGLLKVFVNGELDGSAMIGRTGIAYIPRPLSGPNPSVLYIGIRHNSYYTSPTYTNDLMYSFHGVIDEVRIYNRGLTDSEARALYLSALSIN